jgi:hypothetical protein
LLAVVDAEPVVDVRYDPAADEELTPVRRSPVTNVHHDGEVGWRGSHDQKALWPE